MKKLLFAGVGVVLLAGGVAIAQTPGQPPAPPPPGGEMHPPGPPPGGMGPGGPGMEFGRHHGGPRFMREMMESSKAAHFHFRRGDASVDIKCAADEPTKACVDAATVLMDKLAAQPAK